MKLQEPPGSVMPPQEDRGYRADIEPTPSPYPQPPQTPQPPQAPQPPRREGGIVLPVILIGVGILFLLSTFNIMDWNAWGNLWRLWPLLLIAFGLEVLIGRRSTIASLVIAGLLLVAVVAALVFWTWMPFSEGNVTTENVSQQMQGAASANVSIEFGVGTLNVGALSETSDLVSGRIGRANRETINQDFHVTGSTAYYTIKSTTNWVFPFFDVGGTNRNWDIKLNPSVPTDLNVGTGVGNATLDLQRLNLTRFGLNTGTGSTIVTLPAHGNFNASLQAGVGDITINIPTSMAARIHIDSGLGNQDIPSNFVRTGNDYESPGYSTARERVDLDMKAGVGNITVREVQPIP